MHSLITPEPEQARISRRKLWVPFFMMAGITLLSGSAGPSTGGISFTGMDKLGHFVVFGLLGVAWARVFFGGIRPLAAWIFAVLAATIFGYLDELHQYTNPLRLFEWYDLLADFLGALAGAACYVYWSWLRSLLEWRPWPLPVRSTANN